MANIKRFRIIGDAPYNLYENADVLKMLGWCALPSFNMNIKWSSAPTRFTPTEHGGSLSHYSFEINGEEAVRMEFLQNILTVLISGGAEIHAKECMDYENGEWINWE